MRCQVSSRADLRGDAANFQRAIPYSAWVLSRSGSASELGAFSVSHRGKIVLGYTEAELRMCGTGYQFVHAADMLYCAENHVRSKRPFSGCLCPPLRLMSGLGLWAALLAAMSSLAALSHRMLCLMLCCDAFVTAGSLRWSVVRGI